MATKKKKTASRKPARKSTPARKTAARKTTARKSTTKKAAPRKTQTKAAQNRPAGPREDALASSALKLVDQAASVLRQGIRTSANVTQKTRHDAKEHAHDLLRQATSALDRIISRI